MLLAKTYYPKNVRSPRAHKFKTCLMAQECKQEASSTKNTKRTFVVIIEACAPLLGFKTVQQMKLVEVHYENIA